MIQALLLVLHLGSSLHFEIEPTTLNGTSVFYQKVNIAFRGATTYDIIPLSSCRNDTGKLSLNAHISINQRFMTEAPVGTIEVSFGFLPFQLGGSSVENSFQSTSRTDE